MLKQLILFALLVPLLPALAMAAECGFAHADGKLTIVVGKNAKKCFSSEFREAFAASLTSALADDTQPVDRKGKPYDARTPSSERLWALQERVFQDTQPSGRYFGQQR